MRIPIVGTCFIFNIWVDDEKRFLSEEGSATFLSLVWPILEFLSIQCFSKVFYYYQCRKKRAKIDKWYSRVLIVLMAEKYI